jgi:hypothetical protein
VVERRAAVADAFRLQSYAQDKFPQERRDRFIYRLKKVVVESQRHRDYQGASRRLSFRSISSVVRAETVCPALAEAIEFFLERAENYSAVANDATNQGAGKGLDLRNDAHFQNAEYQLRTLLERFANGQSMQPIIDAVNQLYTDAKNDEDLRLVSCLRFGGLREDLMPVAPATGSRSSIPTFAAVSRKWVTS